MIALVIDVSGRFSKSFARDKKVEEAYQVLVTNLEKRDVISPVLRDQLERYQVGGDELLSLLKQHEELSKDTETWDAAQKLLSAMEQAVEHSHNSNLKRIQSVYEQYLGEQRLWSRFGIGVVFLGFLLILIGVASIYINIATGVVVTIAGIVVNLTSGLFFRQAANAAMQANSVYDKLDKLEDIRSSAEVLSSLRTSLSNLAAKTSL